MWEEVLLEEPGSGWVLLQETGWDALIGWAAGQSNLRRVRRSDEHRRVHVTLVRDGTNREFTEPFTQSDRAIVDESINSYLADAGIPPRPGGYDWYLRVPEPFSSGGNLLVEINTRVYARSQRAVRPSEWRPLIELVLVGIYHM
jgi:hypothetical protein